MWFSRWSGPNFYPKRRPFLFGLELAVALCTFVNVLIVMSLKLLPVANIREKRRIQILIQQSLILRRSWHPKEILFLYLLSSSPCGHGCLSFFGRGIWGRTIYCLLWNLHHCKCCKRLFSQGLGNFFGDSRSMNPLSWEDTLFQRSCLRFGLGRAWIGLAASGCRTPI